MDYIRNQLIETESFKIIQGIIDQEFPDYIFSSTKEEKLLNGWFIQAPILIIWKSSFLMMLFRVREIFLGRWHNFTDTTMALSGINKRLLDKLGIRYECYIADPEVAEQAKAKEWLVRWQE